MATEIVHTIEISLVDISTKSVTLGPQIATIVRKIPGVLFKVNDLGSKYISQLGKVQDEFN
ncbi:hypothetical protein PAAG_00930 [Paracoccidioides lutzii Pb01]|uniref:Uncharacterized protein n=1 Tax=Paracoccidioides lutzii (strain ATCC MYA-826 / Pb01) TaxID=502779 RepID=C1GQY5_PARBA|nr:hypothetical protein PAAG_00930 [Paracoccidioides lutzii Pb01]EEH38009.2 hypothetical protein PAAG_00930 [Paracoccidioides lutzii Pb01]